MSKLFLLFISYSLFYTSILVSLDTAIFSHLWHQMFYQSPLNKQLETWYNSYQIARYSTQEQAFLLSFLYYLSYGQPSETTFSQECRAISQFWQPSWRFLLALSKVFETTYKDIVMNQQIDKEKIWKDGINHYYQFLYHKTGHHSIIYGPEKDKKLPYALA